MSLLLEALKKAALEKQNREASPGATDSANSIDTGRSGTETNSPNLGDTLRYEDEVTPVSNAGTSKDLSETEQDSPATSTISEDPPKNQLDIDDEWLSEPRVDSSVEKQEIDQQEIDTDEELDFEPEFDLALEQEPTSEPELALDDTHEETLSTAEISTVTAEQDDLDQITQDVLDEIAQEEERQKLEQERLLEEEVAKQQQQLEEERLRIERQIEEQQERERKKVEDAEHARVTKAKAAEETRLAKENKDALDQLIASGKKIHKQERRRSAFLYIMLIVTGLGGMLAYYVFLIANTEKSELQAAPIVTDNADIIDVAAMIQSAEINTAQTADDSMLADSTTLSANDQTDNLSPRASSESNNQVLTNSTTTGNITTEVDYLATGEPSLTTNETPSANLNGGATTSQDTITGKISSESATLASGNTNSASRQSAMVEESRAPAAESVRAATRIDPPPSISSYLQPLILAANGDVQQKSISERVIIHHKAEPTQINDLIKAGYSALKSNQFDKADRFYQNALAIEPGQRDAILGAAATATAMGRFEEATALYQRRLEDDPKDPYAHAGLLGLATDSSSRQGVQREVNQLLNQYPESSHLHFLKGVGLAASSQWTQAQGAFYEAYRRDNQNPDYAFNLAVSLDHLSQPSLARVYYERALDLSNGKSAGFDQIAAQKRLSELSQ